jgi:hypothetical protein
MARSRKIQVMISSRCEDKFPLENGANLSQIRRDLKREIEATSLFGKLIYEVWINEETPPQGGKWDSWDVCIQATKECDVLLALANGNAGWAADGEDIGICHAELATALSTAPGKVRLISLGNIKADRSDAGKRNARFQAYLTRQTLFRGSAVRTINELKERVKEALLDATISLAQGGVREASRGKWYSGEALEWQRLDLVAREAKIKEVLNKLITGRTASRQTEGINEVILRIGGHELLIVLHAMPAAFSVGQAKEMVGQPYLNDYKRAIKLVKGVGGPVHLIGCHKAVTEPQAARTLGFSDATFVVAPFGLYVADSVQMIQMIFVANCRDEINTRHGVQRFLEWLNQTGEGERLVDRAKSRANIVRAIAKARGAVAEPTTGS